MSLSLGVLFAPGHCAKAAGADLESGIPKYTVVHEAPLTLRKMTCLSYHSADRATYRVFTTTRDAIPSDNCFPDASGRAR